MYLLAEDIYMHYVMYHMDINYLLRSGNTYKGSAKYSQILRHILFQKSQNQ
jgi:hypothetical protein